MKTLWKIFKRTLYVMLGCMLLFAVGVSIFMKVAPQFGEAPEGQALDRLKKSTNFNPSLEIFNNLVETKMDMGPGKLWETMRDYATAKNTSPADSIPVRFHPDGLLINPTDSALHVTWFGHSAFLIEMEGKRILIDPMLSASASPVSFFAKRFPYKSPIETGLLRGIDLLLLSHDHYDHLDYTTIMALKDQVKLFVTPLGVGNHLRAWGIPKEKIIELDWWENTDLDGLKITAAPARHFSGRGITDRFKTQWASWALKGKDKNIFFSGDSGYAPHFKEIGNRLGPFDFTMIECGQYNDKWEAIHMLPEQSLQAHLDVQGALMMPIHWGAFQLATHEWTDPISRVLKAAETYKVPVAHPYIGQRFSPSDSLRFDRWWVR